MQLITGGSGYFGGYLAGYLAQRELPVRVFDLHDSADRLAAVEFMPGDIRNADQIKAALQGVDVVYNSVAMVPLAKNKKAFWSVNYQGTESLLQACLQAGVKKVIHLSSSAVFGVPRENPVTEKQIPHPGESYGESKLAAEELCRRYMDLGLDITIIRPRTIMGHGRLGIMQILFEWVYQNRRLPILGQGNNKYQFVHAADLAAACLLAAQKTGGPLYHIGAERFGTMRQTLEDLVAHARSSSQLVCLPAQPAEVLMNLTSSLGWSPLGAYHALMYGRSMYFDLTCAQNELGWKPQFSNAEMFAESYDWYVANRTKLLAATGLSQHRLPVKQGILSLVNSCLYFLPPVKG